ncbi:twin-arginine translocation signal domain-containing protein [Natronomonas sp.]|uniref:twin-arginine translocation signal domain-containing protein n=1 Tax=Natronomonas sp. TaxID=2184060 RepID=UPI002FC3129A
MNRRRFLAASAVAGALPLAGCAARETTLQPDVETEDDETHVVYRDGDDRVAVVSYMQRGRATRPPYDLWVTVSHAEGTTIDSLRLELDTAPAERPKPNVYLKTPDGHPYPSMHYHTDPDSGAAIVDVPDTERQGSGSMSLEFLVAPRGEEVVTVGATASLSLSGRAVVGRVYELSDRVEFELTP